MAKVTRVDAGLTAFMIVVDSTDLFTSQFLNFSAEIG
jgi:hypothetical protein